MKIWVHMNGIQQGPYEFEELKQLPIDESTPVWYEGLPAWTPAGQAPATTSLFGSEATSEATTVETPAQTYTTQTAAAVNTSTFEVPEMPKRFFAWSIALTIIFWSPIAILAIIAGIITTVQHGSGNYKGAEKMSNITEWLIILAITFGCITLPMMFIL